MYQITRPTWNRLLRKLENPEPFGDPQERSYPFAVPSSSHDFAHRDRYNLKGDRDKEELALDYAESLDLADKDINDNWDIYQEWSQEGAKRQAEKGQPIVYVKIKKIQPVRSRIQEMELSA